MLRSVGFVLRPYSKPATLLVRTAGVAVGRRRLHGYYTTAGTAAALWFQPVVSETVARSLKAAGFLGVAPGSWDFRRMESCAIRPIIAQLKSSFSVSSGASNRRLYLARMTVLSGR